MTKDSTFDVGRFRFRSAICSVFMCFVIFSILPLSIAAVIPENERTQLVKVYSLNSNQTDVRRADASRSPKYRLAPPLGKKSPTYSAPASVSLNLGVESFSDFSASNASGNLAFADFSYDGDLNNIVNFELYELDKIPQRLGGAHADYPESLLRRGIEGEVRLRIVIDESGNVEIDGVESSPNRLFTNSAIAAAKKLKYETPLKDGKPVRASFILPVPFKIYK